MKQNFVEEAISEHWGDRCPDIDADCACCQAWAEYDRLSAAQAPPVAHLDDIAVDRFAAAMKAKLAEKRAQGYHGWDDPEDCTIEHLSNLLAKHVAKGDPIDVGNFAMMIHQRGGTIG